MIRKISNTNLTIGTSFHFDTVFMSAKEIEDLLGIEPIKYEPGDKVLYEWELEYENEDGKVIPFTLYDWKNYQGLGYDEKTYFHIGTKTTEESNEIYEALTEIVEKYSLIK